MEALQLLRSAAPDTYQLVLTDVCMPELNGIQLLSCVKQDASLRAVPVVSESGWRLLLLLRPAMACHSATPAALLLQRLWLLLLLPVALSCRTPSYPLTLHPIHPLLPCSDVERGPGGDGG